MNLEESHNLKRHVHAPCVHRSAIYKRPGRRRSPKVRGQMNRHISLESPVAEDESLHWVMPRARLGSVGGLGSRCPASALGGRRTPCGQLVPGATISCALAWACDMGEFMGYERHCSLDVLLKYIPECFVESLA